MYKGLLKGLFTQKWKINGCCLLAFPNIFAAMETVKVAI